MDDTPPFTQHCCPDHADAAFAGGARRRTRAERHERTGGFGRDRDQQPGRDGPARRSHVHGAHGSRRGAGRIQGGRKPHHDGRRRPRFEFRAGDPSHAVLCTALGERWRAGISLTIPTGFGADYGSDWAGRYYSDYYTLVYVALTPALSYRVNDKLSLGVATNINYTLSETEVPFNNPGADVADGRLKAELDGIGSSFPFRCCGKPPSTRATDWFIPARRRPISRVI
ncbi:MAG: outer membrane protein transport protein [Gammaproteobacteria bacterium]|nr:outer membrane protein transport protein [Gammaproteobacteria bacterium]